MTSQLQRLWRDTRGQDPVEYVFAMALLGAVVLLAIVGLDHYLSTVLQAIQVVMDRSGV